MSDGQKPKQLLEMRTLNGCGIILNALAVSVLSNIGVAVSACIVSDTATCVMASFV